MATSRKAKIVPGNPKFIEWIDGWLADAERAQNKNLVFVYKKALSNLRKIRDPLPVKRLVDVNGIGDTIMKRLENKVKDHLDAGNALESLYDGKAARDDAQIPEDVAKKAKKTEKAPRANVESSRPASQASSASADEEPKPKKRKTKKYVPAYRSGGFGLLMALYERSLQTDQVFMSKTELVEHAENYWDKSVAANNQMYTHWNSMAQLLKKELVMKRGHPPKFCLTIEGADLAKELWEKTEQLEGGTGSQNSVTKSSQADFPGSSQSSRISEAEVLGICSSQSESAFVETSNFRFWYLDERGAEVSDKDNAIIQISDDFKCLYKVKYHSSQSGHAFAAFIQKESIFPDKDGCLLGWLLDYDAPDEAPGIQMQKAASNVAVSGSTSRSVQVAQSARPPTFPNIATGASASSSVSSSTRTIPKISQTVSDMRELTPWPPRTENQENVKWNGQPICFRKGTYDIFMVLDSRENRAKSTSSADVIRYLDKHRIPYVIRTLEVGDMAWIAKLRNPPRFESHEIVLDFIVERKREDDLVGSIRSGRFGEQKTRLKLSAVSRIFYLIEKLANYNAAEAFGPLRIESAITMNHMLDDVFVHRSMNGEDSMLFLHQLHDIINETYRDKDILALPPDIPVDDIVALKEQKGREGIKYHLTYDSFSIVSTKSKRMRVVDMWLKQLMCIRGLTVHKAITIIEQFPTMTSLMEALRAIPDEKDRLNMIKNIGGIVTRDKIGQALAKSIEQLMLATDYPSSESI